MKYMSIIAGGKSVSDSLLSERCGQEACGSENGSSWCLQEASSEERILKGKDTVNSELELREKLSRRFLALGEVVWEHCQEFLKSS